MSDKSEIVVNGRFEYESGVVDSVREAMATMQEASRAEEGCQDYTFSFELTDPAVVRLTERWDDMDALRRHFAAPHMKAYRDVMAAHPAAQRQVAFFTVTVVEPPSV